MPDAFDFGTVDAGATVEFSARFLTTRRGLMEQLGERLAGLAPPGWRPTVRKWFTPARAAAPFVPVDLSRLKPVVAAPDFAQVTEVAPAQNQSWFGGRSYVVVHGRVKPARAGKYSGHLTVTMDGRKASLPLRVRARELAAGRPRLLVVCTPFEEYATENGLELRPVAEALSAVAAAVDCVEKLPAKLGGYRVILLADSALSGIGMQEVARVRDFVEQGGRLILPCDAFFVGTIPKANEILAGHGLTVITNDMYGLHQATNIVADPLTRGVARLEFFRPSPIVVTDPAKARLLALDPGGAGGFVAVTRRPGGGEVIVITSSLWWLWIGRFNDQPDNARMLQNVLSAEAPVVRIRSRGQE